MSSFMDFIETMFLNLNSLNLPKNLGLEYILFAKNMMPMATIKTFAKRCMKLHNWKTSWPKFFFLIMQNIGQHLTLVSLVQAKLKQSRVK